MTNAQQLRKTKSDECPASTTSCFRVFLEIFENYQKIILRTDGKEELYVMLMGIICSGWKNVLNDH
jgi:hypothetical protein